MNAYHIKLIAIVTMVIDHVGAFLFPNILFLRVIGRLAFPLFSWLIANGAYYSKNRNKYLIRLFVFAIISQVPYLLTGRLIHPDFQGLNIFFTLFLGLLAIEIIRKYKSAVVFVTVVLVIGLLAEIAWVSYGLAGILSIVFFYKYFKDFKKMLISQALIFSISSILPQIIQLFSGSIIVIENTRVIQSLAVFSLIFIYLYNEKPGPRLKYIFYVFYPAHLIIIYMIRLVFY
jgi:hypothetical protein